MGIALIEPKEEYIKSYGETLDTVAKEKIYLGKLEGYPMDETIIFMKNTIDKNIPFLLAVNTNTNQVIGWCDAQPRAGKIGYLGLGLLREYRGQGIGKQLICALLEKGRKFGYKQIDLEVRGSNKRALRLYESVGFSIVRTIKNGLVLGSITDDVIEMTIEL